MQQSHVNELYASVLTHVFDYGALVKGRNGSTRQLTGLSMTTDLSVHGFPIVSTRHINFKASVGEFCAFMHAADTLEQFERRGCKFWRANQEAWVKDSKGYPKGFLGRIYGIQWREFAGLIDQWANIRQRLTSDPNTRRAVMTSMNPEDEEYNMMCLPPCHVCYQFIKGAHGLLELIVTQRSLDLVIGLPYDWTLFGLMLHTMADEVGMKPGRLVINVGSAHIYMEHEYEVQEIIKLGFKTNPVVFKMDNRLEYEPERYELLDYPTDRPVLTPRMIA